jgi:hypothetical protein
MVWKQDIQAVTNKHGLETKLTRLWNGDNLTISGMVYLKVYHRSILEP